MRLPVAAWLLFWSASPVFAQINFNANQTVPPYAGVFRPGANMGWYAPWTDDWLADIAAGNPEVNVEGVGVKAFRPFLPEHFLEDWGYEIRLSTFQHYDKLGLKDNTVAIGYPKAGHRDPAWYCPWEQSHLFANLYLPIWDGGANGTPVHDQNYYALYLYKMVSVYKDYVGFWEVWNEPDHDYTGNGWKPANWQGNWWENTPQPCDYALKAPVQHYVRMLRITYEVVKFLDPEAYVAIGGLGYPSFLDVVLRNTDNPNGGTPTPDFPQYGGAWFDAFAYHSYPHIDGSLRHWDNNIMGFAYDRHSDAAAAGVFRLKKEFEKVLHDRGYDGSTYPRKLCIMTEGNLPRFSDGAEYIGTPEVQRNFILKTLAQCEMNNVSQYDVFIMSDFLPEGQGGGAFDYMGLFKWLSAYLPYQTEKNDLAIAYKTFADLAFGKRFDPVRTSMLNMPQGTGGVAFRDTATGSFTYVLWAKTHTDQSENVTYIYFPPAELGLTDIKIRKWNYSETKDSVTSDAMLIKLLASPIFVTDLNAIGERSSEPEQAQALPVKFEMHCSPQPFVGELNVQIRLPERSPVTVEVFDLQGKLVRRLADGQELEAGVHSILFENEGLPGGVFLVKAIAGGQTVVQKIVHRRS